MFLREQCAQKGKCMRHSWVKGMREERKTEWGKMDTSNILQDST